LLCPDNKKVYTDFVDGVKETNVLRLLIDLTPFIPLSLKGEGLTLLLSTPALLTTKQGMSKRGKPFLHIQFHLFFQGEKY